MDKSVSSKRQKTINIMLFGQTGAGKSSLGNQMSGQNLFYVGGSLISRTISVDSQLLTWPLDPSIKVKIIDTPGFADNRPEMTDPRTLAMILDFLKNLKDGLHIAIFCLPAKTRIDKYDIQELEMLGLLLGDGFFEHVCFAVTQANTLKLKDRQTVCENFTKQLPDVLLENGLPPFTQDKILFADFDNFEESFMKPFTRFIHTTISYIPRFPEKINTKEPRSIQRFLAKPEIKELMDYYENLLALQRQQALLQLENARNKDNSTFSRVRKLWVVKDE